MYLAISKCCVDGGIIEAGAKIVATTGAVKFVHVGVADAAVVRAKETDGGEKCCSLTFSSKRHRG